MLYPEFSVLGKISRDIKLLSLYRKKAGKEDVRVVADALEVLSERLEETAAKHEGESLR